MNNFQTILMGIFIGAFVVAILIFSGVVKVGEDKKSETGIVGQIEIWGTLPHSYLKDAVSSVSSQHQGLMVKYIPKDKDTIQAELLEAFARNTGPDIYIISTDMIQENEDFILKIPYESYPERNFRDTFIDGADIYLDSEGVVGLPILSDPLVLYYNQNILSNNLILYPPKTWDELFDLSEILTKKDNSGIISQSMISMGSFSNINNAKDIIATLLIQNGNNITKREAEERGISFKSVLLENPLNLGVSPAQAVLDFYMTFSNISSPYYSWSRALPNSLDMFTSGKLVFYIGRASELFKIQSQNPNLSFNVAELPQMKDTNFRRTFGEIYGVVINKKSKQISTAVAVASFLSSPVSADIISTTSSLPPVLRTLLSSKSKDQPYLDVFFNSAIITRSWLDPNKEKSNFVFRELVESISSNTESQSGALSKANQQLNLLNKK